MKKLIPFLASLLTAGVVIAGGSPLQFTDATIQITNSVLATQTPDDYNASSGLTGQYVSGWIDSVYIDITAGTTASNTVILKTLGDTGTGASRTILTLSQITADGVYPVRDLVTGVTGRGLGDRRDRE